MLDSNLLLWQTAAICFTAFTTAVCAKIAYKAWKMRQAKKPNEELLIRNR